jgi:hypothetical protein
MTQAAFQQCFVAFLDVLGFSEMVARAVTTVGADELNRLYRCHVAARALTVSDRTVDIVQFSDSVVISKPYAAQDFRGFVQLVANYQRLLLREGILCRGGLSRGAHYSKDAFVMSEGLISAYQLESKKARYPRVVVSDELLLLVGERSAKQARLLREDDGVVFVDFLTGGRERERRHLSDAAKACVAECRSHGATSVLEKGVWLAAYSDQALNTQLSTERFGVPDWSRFAT